MKKINYNQKSIQLHKKIGGKLSISLKTPIKNKDDLSTVYSPGIAGPCLEIHKKPEAAKSLVSSKKTIAVISDGSAVLGLGNIGALAALPVMEGKSALFKKFSNLDSFPLVIKTQDTEEFIKTVENIAPTFGGINLEDISAPRCFTIEKRLKESLDIPVFHDDQHGTAIVVLAGIINALKITKKSKEKVKVIVNGVGAAGVAIIKLLLAYGIKQIVCCDSKGVICESRDNLNETKKYLLDLLPEKNACGDLRGVIQKRDIFIGVSKEKLLTPEMVRSMNPDPIIFALANPNPEIMPDLAAKSGAKVYASGRSDFPNQINNVLIFPAVFKAALDKGIPQILNKHKLQLANALAKFVTAPNAKKIIPSPFSKGLVEYLVKAVKK